MAPATATASTETPAANATPNAPVPQDSNLDDFLDDAHFVLCELSRRVWKYVRCNDRAEKHSIMTAMRDLKVKLSDPEALNHIQEGGPTLSPIQRERAETAAMAALDRASLSRAEFDDEQWNNVLSTTSYLLEREELEWDVPTPEERFEFDEAVELVRAISACVFVLGRELPMPTLSGRGEARRRRAGVTERLRAAMDSYLGQFKSSVQLRSVLCHLIATEPTPEKHSRGNPGTRNTSMDTTQALTELRAARIDAKLSQRLVAAVLGIKERDVVRRIQSLQT